MSKRLVLSFALILMPYFYINTAYADNSEISLNLETGLLEIPEVRFPDGSIQGPFQLRLNSSNQFELVNNESVQAQAKSLSNEERIAYINSDFSRLYLPYVAIHGAIGSIIYASLVLNIQPNFATYIFSIALLKVLTATLPVNGTITSNDGSANYIIRPNSTITITPFFFYWCIFMQIQNFPDGYGEGTVQGYMPRSFANFAFLFAALGKIGMFYAFSNQGAEVELASNGKAKFIRNNKGLLESILVTADHNEAPHKQAFEMQLIIPFNLGDTYLGLLKDVVPENTPAR